MFRMDVLYSLSSQRLIRYLALDRFVRKKTTIQPINAIADCDPRQGHEEPRYLPLKAGFGASVRRVAPL